MDEQENEQAAALWTVDDVAHRLSVSRSSVYRMANAGEIPQITLSHSRRIVRFDPKEIEQWINSRKG